MDVAINHIEFDSFIKDFKLTLQQLFRGKESDAVSNRDLSAELVHTVLTENPLAVAIPEQFGGRGVITKECLSLLAAASYESLSLSLIFGINIALFLQPVTKYANEQVKEEIFDRFLQHQNMGGLMITEPAYGSDALNMKTRYTEREEGYHITGTKHWQGLTGLANYWLIACKKETQTGDLGRDIDFFICDTTQPKQHIRVKEYYDNLGLSLIPYGLNILDLQVPSNYRLQPQSTGIQMMLDILHRSRMQFPGMAMGFIQRMLDEATSHCTTRKVGAGSLLLMDQIQFQIGRIQSAYTLCSAMCVRSSRISGIDQDLASEGLEANSIKTVVTDLMQESAQVLVQLSGARGYRTSHIGGSGIIDSRAFQIFEGANEMLYSQIGESIIRMMKKQKQENLFDFLKDFPPTAIACLYFKKELSFQIHCTLSQRKQVELGKILARIICMGYVIDLGEDGFRKELAENCLCMVQQEVSALFCSFRFENKVKAVEEYSDESSWMNFV
ncbi:acyl-CoA dehydrogenase family protein [Xanthocytophaga agilis]|uniref:Acyl-CoA dehydrogenase family protein n=1 Tax=Xanthocytophaga agilis TaxID=3048010 RepID=A0AAE3R1Y9_9BACT|nr:acyl-CoA dehydrogenase family protein [Xanthocytophaga agilis]MDJ1501590.1 acyl-CoA dehydrogenase family protein [Xanthocytophaga agilis]